MLTFHAVFEKGDIEKKFEELANSVLNENKKVPESNPHDEDIMTPGMDTINHMVKEMPFTESLEDILSNVSPNPVFVKREEEVLLTNTDIKLMTEKRKVSLNNQLNEEIKFGLNDRLAFIKHLFEGSTEDFNRVVSQLNSLSSKNEIKSFIEERVKPDYNNWEGEEEYEKRFLALIGISN